MLSDEHMAALRHADAPNRKARACAEATKKMRGRKDIRSFMLGAHDAECGVPKEHCPYKWKEKRDLWFAGWQTYTDA